MTSTGFKREDGDVTRFYNKGGELRYVWAPTDIENVQQFGAGTTTHAQLDTHSGDPTIHFAEATISHNNIQDIGTLTHAQIDTHAGNATVHFTEASITHGNILNSGAVTHANLDAFHGSYAEDALVTTIGGPWGATTYPFDLNITLWGNTVTISFPTAGGVATVNAMADVADVLPVAYRPAQDSFFLVHGMDASVLDILLMGIIAGTGAISFGVGAIGVAFTNANDAFINAGSVSFHV